MSTSWSLIISVVLLAASAFFVAAEFSLVASKRHKLEAKAENGSRAAKAALSGTRELTVMLAGAQLGITVCTVGLGALAEPALAHLLDPMFLSWGLPHQVSYAIAFVLALFVVVFLHMVVGEMAPKSWAIAHPEDSALLLALPFRGFAWLLRPVLLALNSMANGLIRLFGVNPKENAEQAHNAEDLDALLRDSHAEGLLPESQHRLLSGALGAHRTPLREVMVPRDRIVTVAPDATAADIEAICAEHGRSRLVVDESGAFTGVAHIRDAVRSDASTTARELADTPVVLSADTTASDAVTTLRSRRAQLALVSAPDGMIVGLVSFEDLLEEILGDFEDETDARSAV